MASEQPTPLGVYLECLHIIETLEPDDRKRVIDALSNFAAFNPKVLRGAAQSDHERAVGLARTVAGSLAEIDSIVGGSTGEAGDQ